jgi:outer membrane protein insertion porin family
VNTSTLDVAAYQTNTAGAGIRFAVPMTEYDTITTGFTVEKTKLGLDPLTASLQYLEFVAIFGDNTTTFRYNIGYSRDTRDSLTYPTRGRFMELGTEVGMPPGDLTYYRVNGVLQQLYTPDRLPWLTFLGNLELGYAAGYNNKPLPFFKNFYAGGVGSVRGYQTASLGPEDLNGNALGGNRRGVGNLEVLFPMPGSKDKGLRLSTFLDTGWVWGANQQISATDLRWSTGLAVSWDSPVGPLKFSFAYPFRTQPQDKLERFQFQLGRIF